MRKSFGARIAVAGVDIHLRPGEIVGLLGASGSGKSTIFNMIAGTIRPDAGRFHLSGRDVTHAGIDARARLGLGYVPQAPLLFPKLTVDENLRIAIEASGSSSFEATMQAIRRAFSIEALRQTRFSDLSGGQRRWVEIAFAMCGKPRFLLLDEPFTGLDPIVSANLITFLKRLARIGIGILVTDHNVRHVLKSVERAYLIDGGTILASGPAQSIIHEQAVRSSFLGERFAL